MIVDPVLKLTPCSLLSGGKLYVTEAEEEPGLKRRYCFATLGCLLILAAVVISILIAGRNRVNESPLSFLSVIVQGFTF